MEKTQNKIGDLVSTESIAKIRLECKLKYLKLTYQEDPTEETEKEIVSVKKAIQDLETNFNEIINEQSLKSQLDLVHNVVALSYFKTWKRLNEQERIDKIEEYVNEKLFFQSEKDKNKLLEILKEKYGTKKFNGDVLYSSSLGQIISIKGIKFNNKTYLTEFV
jgi:hypothetical protein